MEMVVSGESADPRVGEPVLLSVTLRPDDQ